MHSSWWCCSRRALLVAAATVACGAAKLWDGCFGAENTDSGAFLAACGIGAYPEPGCAVLHSPEAECSWSESLRMHWWLEGWECHSGGIPSLLLLQEAAPTAQEQSSSLSDTYLLLFSLIPCQQGDDCWIFLLSSCSPPPS